MQLSNSLLGKNIRYKNKYDPTILFKIPRKDKRVEIGLNNYIPFFGIDIWNAYEISWLNPKGKPCAAIGEFYIQADSQYIIESKSFKLYLNSLNDNKFNTEQEVLNLLTHDLSQITNSVVDVRLISLNTHCNFRTLTATNIDSLDIECKPYDTVNSKLIKYENVIIEEEIYSNLLKSNCLVTGQPDWGTIFINYKGKKIDHSSLLQYIVSFRNHNEFHEQCVERIFMDIYRTIEPEYLSVYARYTRRGGLDICPYRSTNINFLRPNNTRLIRQ